MGGEAEDVTGRDGRRAARRVVAMALVGALVAAVAISRADPPPDDPPGAGPGADEDADPSRDAVSWSRARDEGLTATFQPTCDRTTGRVAIPYVRSAECHADVDDNGGATYAGVSADVVTVVYYSPAAEDPVLDYLVGPLLGDDTVGEVERTLQTFVDLFGGHYQTYGRRVEVRVVQATGTAEDEDAARADARRAIERHRPFAVLGGPAATTAWADELAAAGVVCLHCGNTGSDRFREERAPFLVDLRMSTSQISLHGAEYVSRRLSGRPAAFAGPESMRGTERVFGLVHLSANEESELLGRQYESLLGDRGVELAARLPYQLDPDRLDQQAAAIVTHLRDAGVTSVILQADGAAVSWLSAQATALGYFPEWVVTGGASVDTTALGRTFDQEQWAHAFGITARTVPTTPELDVARSLHRWYAREMPAAEDAATHVLSLTAPFFAALQSAGPRLTPATFRDGIFALEPGPPARTVARLSWGEHGLWGDLDLATDWSGVDDATEWWWDADAVGPDELGREGTGMVRFADGGRRFLPDEWDDVPRAFDDVASVLVIEELPPGDAPPRYPR